MSTTEVGPILAAWKSGQRMTSWGERTFYGWDLGSREWRGVTDAECHAHAGRWWARRWSCLSRRERRRLIRKPALLAAHVAWDSAHRRRAAEDGLLYFMSNLTRHAADQYGAVGVLERHGIHPIDNVGNVLGADGPLSFEETP